MTVQTPDQGPSAATIPIREAGEGATSAREKPEALEVKRAGEGAVEARNPFEDMMLSIPTPEAYGQAAQPQGGDRGSGPVDTSPASGRAGQLIAAARKFLGTPYKWGGTSPLGFDCSGFTQYVYRQFGINLPRVSYQQASAGKRISLNELRPGDLVFWDTSSRNNGADHVAIYIGGGQVIHAPKPGDRVKISPLWAKDRAWGAAMNL